MKLLYYSQSKNIFSQEVCPISYETFTPNQQIYELSCGHLFSIGSFHSYAERNSKNTCPLCSKQIPELQVIKKIIFYENNSIVESICS